jgi:hypothetical protein
VEVFMTETNFSKMTKPELRSYVIAHPDNLDAFHAFVDRFSADAPSETFKMPTSAAEIEEIERLIQQKIQQSKINY